MPDCVILIHCTIFTHLTHLLHSEPGSSGSFIFPLFLLPSPPTRAEGSGGDEGLRPRVQQLSHPIQQLYQLWRGRYWTAGIPDGHRSEQYLSSGLLKTFILHFYPATILLTCPHCSFQESVVRPSLRTCGSLQRNLSTWRARWSMSPNGTPSSS